MSKVVGTYHMMGQADADTSFSFGNNDFTEVTYTGLEPEFHSINSRGALTLPQPHTHTHTQNL